VTTLIKSIHSCEREPPRVKPVASKRDFLGGRVAASVKTPRVKPVASKRPCLKKSFKDAIDAALPPDVRRGSASPFKSRFQWGCALGPGLAPSLWAKGRTMGLAQILRGFNGEAEPRLTSGGEAATLPTKGLFVQAHPNSLASKVRTDVALGNSQYRPR
jgi:hypothetical protein